MYEGRSRPWGVGGLEREVLGVHAVGCGKYSLLDLITAEEKKKREKKSIFTSNLCTTKNRGQRM
jgi:hypothetical protein